MTRHDIIELADQCGATLLDGWDVDMLTKFAKRVAERKWQGLTEEDAAACWSASAVDTWKAIEAALKEKNT